MYNYFEFLPKHAPKNAFGGRATGKYSFLGGAIYEWVDKEGRYLGESNSVPPNIYGEKTLTGDPVTPRSQKIAIKKYELLILHLQYKYKDNPRSDSGGLRVANWDYIPEIIGVDGIDPNDNKELINLFMEETPKKDWPCGLMLKSHLRRLAG